MLFCPAHAECQVGLGTEDMKEWPCLMVERGLVLADLRFLTPLAFLQCVLLRARVRLATFVPASAWSMVLADPGAMDFSVVQAGLVPGLPCNYRAEMLGV